MSKRSDFTLAVRDLINFFDQRGKKSILDYALRGKEEQKRLFEKGLSKCDGEVKVSKHQMGLAIDVYFLTDDEKALSFDKDVYFDAHQYWEILGGQPMLERDQDHFEF